MRAFETRSLELVAAALSEEYGVSVRMGGLRAETRRNQHGLPVITIPAISSDNPDYRVLIRGYIDHEVGHLRFSDEKAIETGILADPELSGSVKAISSIYEDIMVDRLMGECFIGCRGNLRKLAYLVYITKGSSPPDACELLRKYNDGVMNPRDLPWHVWHAVLRYLVLAGRADGLPRLAPGKDVWGAFLNMLAPGMIAVLKPILDRLPAEGTGSERNMVLARETASAVARYFMERRWGGAERIASISAAEIPWLLRNGGEARDTSDLGASAASLIDSMIMEMGELPPEAATIRHAHGSDVWSKRITRLADTEMESALRSSAKMAAKMHALLQSHVLNREGPFRRGKLHTRELHKLFICRDDIFRRNVERRKLDTEIALCVDMSGSMRFDGKAPMASGALYAIAHSLARIQGLRFHILGFFDNNVVEIVKPDSPLSSHFGIVPDGGTLCGLAAREAAQSLTMGKRKIIVMITDGDANDPENFNSALSELRSGGIEFLGIGIRDSHILDYLPPEDCRVISSLNELAESVIAMLRKKMGVRA